MQTYARWLFGTAALLNIAFGLALVFVRPWAHQRLGIEPAHGVDQVLANFAGLLIALLGVIYALIAREPDRYRPIILIGALGKLAAVALAVTPWLRGEIPPALPILISGDAIYAALFLDFLRRTRSGGR